MLRPASGRAEAFWLRRMRSTSRRHSCTRWRPRSCWAAISVSGVRYAAASARMRWATARLPGSGFLHHHGEGRHSLGAHRGADVAVVNVQGNHVVLGNVVLAQLPHQLAGVAEPATWNTARQPTLARMVSRMVRDRSSSLARLWVARMKLAPNLPSSLTTCFRSPRRAWTASRPPRPARPAVPPAAGCPAPGSPRPPG